ncbi:Thiol:disulfide oxidoreductase TlpA [Rhodovulum sp. PH10]|uniref:thiol:disulfide interchange protein TlpA n=1 Tax=Rhodovulum sp. PH10 TaxID=1187851 RepID=UPI00027C2E84|nr:TlpA disulfide reductase family protein [Rhodovulum sp. PH10]EJW10453.1 Thiol:disulfide oxidoreductase TlpA [Rhodovulum sp. PH10]
MTEPSTDPATPPRRRILAIAVLGLGVAVAAGAIYGFTSFRRNADAPACTAALARARTLAPLAKGEVAAVVPAEEARSLKNLEFIDGTGAKRTLADWKGRTVLLNVWATWCVPCREEMPALDALERQLGGPKFEVVAVNADTRNPDKPKKWLDEVGIEGLAFYADPSGQALRSLNVFGLPSTWLVDGDGCVVASLAGPAAWSSPDGIAMVKAAMGE